VIYYKVTRPIRACSKGSKKSQFFNLFLRHRIGGIVPQENEVILVIFGIMTLLLVWSNRRQLEKVKAIKSLLCSYCFLFAGWILTVLESYFFPETLNFMEHFCYLASAVFLLDWLLSISIKDNPEAIE